MLLNCSISNVQIDPRLSKKSLPSSLEVQDPSPNFDAGGGHLDA